MSIKIYVGNLSFDSTEADLKGLFATYGEVVSAKVIVTITSKSGDSDSSKCPTAKKVLRRSRHWIPRISTAGA
jgi:RNA recognition motif-containing protein